MATIVRPMLMPTADQKAGLDAAATPITALNPVLTAADAAVPAAHATSHATGQSDALAPSDIGAAPSTVLDSVNDITFNTAPSVPAHAEGNMYWDATDRTLAIDMAHTDVTLQVGQEQFVRVFNNTGGAIANGKVVYISGASGNRPTVALADADTEATQYVLGVVTHTLDAAGDGRYGYCTVQGIVRGFDTQGMTPGAPLWLSSTAGSVTQTRPPAPAHAVYVGVPLNATNNGSIYVNPRAGYEVGELHDVLLSGTAEDEVLQYNASTQLWENGSPKIPMQYATENNGPAGFPVTTGITLSLTENVGAVNDTFSVTVTGTNFVVYCDGTRYVKNTETVTQVGATTKRYYIYYSQNGTLTLSGSPWSLEAGTFNGEAPVCTVYWDAVNHRGLLENERHHSWRDIHWHHWAHDSIGARYRSGFDLTKPVASGDIADFSISSGEMYDEDISNASNASPTTTCQLWYHNGSDMVFERDSATLYKASAGVPQYDNGTGLAAKTQSNTLGYFVSWVYAGNSYTDTAMINVVVGQDTNGDMTLTEAQNASYPSLPAGFVIEWKLLYKIIWRYGISATTWISTTDYRLASSLPSGLVPTSNITAASVSFSDYGTTAGPNVQQALQDLTDEKQANLTFGIADTNSLRVDDAAAADNDYAKFTANGLEGVPYATVLSDIGAAPVSHGHKDRIVAVFDGGGGEIADNKKVYVYVPFDCTINDWTCLADQSGSVTIDVWKDSYANFPPTDSDSITGSGQEIKIASSTKGQDVDVTNWDNNPQTITAGDVLCFNVDSCTDITWAIAILTVTRSA